MDIYGALMWKWTTLLALLFATVAEAAPPVASFVATPVQGTVCVAPCAVHFDATATTDADTTKPFHDLTYYWDFDDAAVGGNWSFGAQTQPKNSDRGPLAGHVYTVAGTYDPVLTVRDNDGNRDTETVSITVTDPATQFSDAETFCFNASGSDFTNCPGTANRTTQPDFDVALASCVSGTNERRCLFKGGNNFISSTLVNLPDVGSAGNVGFIGSFGAGAALVTISNAANPAPAVNVQGESWTVAGINFVGSGGTNTQIARVEPTYGNLTLYNIVATEIGSACIAHTDQTAATHNDLIAFVGVSCTMQSGLGTQRNGVFMRAERFMVIGSLIDNNTSQEFNMRTTHNFKEVVAHNTMSRAGTGATGRNPLQLRAWGGTTGCGPGGGSPACDHDTDPPATDSRYIVVRNNKLGSNSSGSQFIRICQNNECGSPGAIVGSSGEQEDILIEDNYFHHQSGYVATDIQGIDAQGGNITVRNNVYDFRRIPSGTVRMFTHKANVATELTNDDGVVVTGNTGYFNEATTSIISMCDSGSFGTGHICQLNLLYIPNQTVGALNDDVGTGWSVASLNDIRRSPDPFDNVIPAVDTSVFGDFALDSASTARNLGTPTATLSLDGQGMCRPAGDSHDAGGLEQGAVACPLVVNSYACDCETGAEDGCVVGSDSNPGTLEAPFESYDKLQDRVEGMACGDTFNFCRGGKWTTVAGSADWTRAGLNCAADNPIKIQSYHPTGTNFVAKPRIELAAHTVTFNFDDAGNNIWLQNLDLACSGACTAGGTGTVVAQTHDTFKFDAMILDGWTTGLQSNSTEPLTVMTVINNQFKNMDVLGLLATPATGSVFNNNLFYNNGCLTGTTCATERALYLTCLTASECARTFSVTNNTFTDNTISVDDIDAGGPEVADTCQGNTVSLRGGTILFEGNTFNYTKPIGGGCTNVRMGTVGDADQVCTDCTFKRNRMIGGNTGLIMQSWVDGGDGDSWGGIVENNIIVLPETDVSTFFAAAISGQDGVGVDNANTLIRNNSIIVGDNDAAGQSTAFDIRDNSGTYVIRNNTIRLDGLGANVCFRFFATANLTDRIDTDYNLCDRLADPGTNGWGSLGGAPVTLATFHAADADTDDDQSWDAQSGFVGLSPDWDMHLVPDLIQLIGFPFFGQFVTLEIDGGGDPNNFAPQDIDGMVRPLGNPLGLGFVPDIGAYEFLGPVIPLGR